MADIVLSYTIPEAKVSTAMEGYLKVYPNLEKEEDGETLKYTDAQWVKEHIRRLVIRQIHRGLQLIANEGAIVETDDTIVE